MIVFSMVDPSDTLRHVDLFIAHPIEFSALWDASDVLDLDGVPVRTASIDHLIQMKEASGRSRDAEDLDVLRELRNNE